MSDGTSCGIFAELFYALHEGTLTAELLYELSQQYDFDPYDMRVDEILAKYDLVRVRWDDSYQEWRIVYSGYPGFKEAYEWEPNWAEQGRPVINI